MVRVRASVLLGKPRFQLADPFFGLHPSGSFGIGAGLGIVSAGALGVKGCYVPPRGRVMPAQFAALPPQVQAQLLAVSLQHVLRQLINVNGHVLPVLQPLACQACPVMLSRLVKPPVLQNSKARVVITLGAGIGVRCAYRRHLQHEVRRLPLLGDDVAVADLVS